MQATAMVQDVYKEKVYSPQSQNKSRVPDATTNRDFLCQKQSDKLQNNFKNWMFPTSKFQLC